jgi:MoaA/NifB/PqqE/SkfB family radical SAM enzyme
MAAVRPGGRGRPGARTAQLPGRGAEGAARIGGYAGGRQRKLAVAALVRPANLPLTANFVVHRRNADHFEAMLDLALAIGAPRVEIANVQYYGWVLRNRTALMPTREQVDRMCEKVDAARERLKGPTPDRSVIGPTGQLLYSGAIDDTRSTRPKDAILAETTSPWRCRA